METKKEILKICMKNGFLLDKEVLDVLVSFDVSFSIKLIQSIHDLKIKDKLLTKNLLFDKKKSLLIFFDSEHDRRLIEKLYSILDPLSLFHDNVLQKNSVVDIKILSPMSIVPRRVLVADFVRHFKNRYEQISSILQKKNLNNLKSIRRISMDREMQSIIVMIINKRITKNKNILLDVEDLTGRSRILINENKKELYEACKNILPDEVVAFEVSGSKEILYASSVVFPDISLFEKKKTEEDVFIAVTSDIHVGSTMFLEKNFLEFIKWINGEIGSEDEKNISKKIKYLFIVGDSIDGVGVFPDQDKFLKIPEILAQYKKLAEYLNLIRKDVVIILSPGQHDAVWVGEPQLKIAENWAPDFYKIKNLFLVTNPCFLEIKEGFKFLMYHGASFHGVVEQIPEIRINHGNNNPTLILKELLKARHLAPTHGECDYIPIQDKDPLVIDIVPDIILTGDLHRSEVSVYNNILLIASSCWQSITPFEEKVGNNPDPCKVPLFNLKTREIKIMDFSTPKNDNVELNGVSIE